MSLKFKLTKKDRRIIYIFLLLMFVFVCGLKSLSARDFVCKSKLRESTSKSRICFAKGYKPIPQTLKTEIEIEVFPKIPLKFDKKFKNPCAVLSLNKDKVSSRLVCLPYFFIIGMPKSGTTDLWHKILRHPQVIAHHRKEPQWFSVNHKRFDRQVLDDYFRVFLRTSQYIAAEVQTSNGKNQIKGSLVTGEATVDTIFEHKYWQQFPGNKNCNEPVQINAHIIKKLNPQIKLIVMLRDPIERLYSDYLFQSKWLYYSKSKNDFHREVLTTIGKHLDCRKYFTMRGCAYNSSIDSVKARLRIGMYSIFLEDWFRVFPRKQFFVLKFEDYIRNPIHHLTKILHFLNISELPHSELKAISKSRPLNRRTQDDIDLGDMLTETRHILTAFYRPFNDELNKLLLKFMY